MNVLNRARSSPRRVALAACAAAFSVGCEDGVPPTAGHPPASGEQSPSAGILPAPLAESGIAALDARSATARARASLPTEGPLPREQDLPRAQEAFAFRLRFFPPHLSRRTSPKGVSFVPELEGQLLVSAEGSTERLRLIVGDGAFLLAPKVELRSRADQLGQILVWPDQRSYRVVPVGALGALFVEGRVDVMPRFVGRLEKDPDGFHARVTTPIGTIALDVDSSRPPEWPKSELVCRTLLELIRAENADFCRSAWVPTSGVVTLDGGLPVPFNIRALPKITQVPAPSFLIPPAMPIHKPGEVSPDALTLADPEIAETSFEALHLTETDTAPEHTTFENRRGLPLIFFVEDRLVRVLWPRQTLSVLGEGPLRYRALSLFAHEEVRGTAPRGASVQLRAASEVALGDEDSPANL
jgi:hypothetical protein